MVISPVPQNVRELYSGDFSRKRTQVDHLLLLSSKLIINGKTAILLFTEDGGCAIFRSLSFWCLVQLIPVHLVISSIVNELAILRIRCSLVVPISGNAPVLPINATAIDSISASYFLAMVSSLARVRPVHPCTICNSARCQRCFLRNRWPHNNAVCCNRPGHLSSAVVFSKIQIHVIGYDRNTRVRSQ